MLQALAAIEDLAAPESRDRLDFALLHAPLDLNIDAGSAPAQQALHLWLYKPFALPTPTETKTAEPETNTPAPAPPTQDPGALYSPNSVRPEVRPALAPRPELRLRLSVLFFEIDLHLRRDFFDRFHLDLRTTFPALPERSPDNEDFHDAVFLRVARPESLPQRMIEALLAIQELADPENRPLLRGLLAQSGIRYDPSTPADQLALQFWLRCPFLAGRLEHLRSQLPAKYLPAPAANGQNGDPPPSTSGPLPNSQPSTLSPPGDLAAIARFPRNKISRLPSDLRESLNKMLRQRITYAQILAKLGEHANGLNKSNLSRWKKTGYLLWLAEQQRRDDAQAQLQLLFDLVREKDNGKIHEATQQIAALRISQVLAAFDPAALTQAFQQQPQAFVRLVQTLPSLSRGGMDCERLVVELAERKALLDQEKTPKKRGITAESLHYMQEKLNLM